MLGFFLNVMVVFEHTVTLVLFFNFHNQFLKMYFIKKKMRIANIFICHSERLCSMFGGSGIQVSVKGHFQKIFGGV